MFEESFVELLRQYPAAVNSRKLFIGLMKDFFPEQQMHVNLITTAFDLGIVEELNKTSQISNAFAFRFVKRMLDEYGVSRINADWAISIWCVCYGKQILHKKCDIEISKAKTGSAVAIRDDQNNAGKRYNDLFKYRSLSDGYGIGGFTEEKYKTLIIPSMHNGKPVTHILAGAFRERDIQEAVMTDGVVVIEDGAFQNCEDLNQVILPESLREIGDSAFSGCVNLSTAALPHALERIGCSAFEGSALKQADIPDSVLAIEHGAFNSCRRLSSVHLPAQLLDLPDEVFKGCTSLKKLALPEGIQSIGKEAFSGCSALIDLIIPDTVTEIGENAFTGMNDMFNLICTQKSVAEQYARRYSLPFQIVF